MVTIFLSHGLPCFLSHGHYLFTYHMRTWSLGYRMLRLKISGNYYPGSDSKSDCYSRKQRLITPGRKSINEKVHVLLLWLCILQLYDLNQY